MKLSIITAALLSSTVASAATAVDGWYTSLFGGYTYLPANISSYPNGLLFNNTAYTDGYNAGGRVGYQSNPIRYELEYTYLHAVVNHFDVSQIPQTNVTGYNQGNVFMANIYYDFREILPAISPFLGMGIGYANIQATLASTGPLTNTYFHTNDNVFAYQGTAGLTYNFSENYALNIAYRYIATDKPSDFGKVFQAHIANAGVIYRFDRGQYK